MSQNQWTELGTEHAITLTGLEVNTSYWAYIRANDTADVLVTFTTSNIVDLTPPELLNLEVEVLDDGKARISWYTSESSTEEIYLDDALVFSNQFVPFRTCIRGLAKDGDRGVVHAGNVGRTKRL